MGFRKRLGSVLWNSLGYMAGQAGLMAFSFVTFPLFTRLLAKSDYGLLSLTNTTLSILGLVVGLGLPNAVVRFAAERLKEDTRDTYLRFNATLLTGATVIAAAGAALVLLLSAVFPLSLEFRELRNTFQYVAVVLVSRSAMNILLEFYRVARNVRGYNLVTLSNKIANVGCSIAGYWWLRSLSGLLLGMAVGEVVSTVVAAALAHRYGYWSAVRLSMKDLSAGVRFAGTLMLAQVCASIMTYGDRYFIQGYLGPSAVAGYAVAYDFCLYMQVLFTTSFRLSVLPEIVSRYTESGAEEAGRFLAKSFQYFSWLMIGVGFGAVAVGQQFLTTLASAKYADAGRLLPWLVPGILLGSLSFLFSSGLYLVKRNDLWFWVTAASAVLNTLLNIILIPRIGVLGAAISTLVTYVAQTVAAVVVSRRFLPVPFHWGSFLRTLASGAVMFVLVRQLAVGWADTFAVKVAGGVLVYGFALILLEKQARHLVWSACVGRSPAH
jgi:O-antigen/teichoic acid export membrane protein